MYQSFSVPQPLLSPQLRALDSYKELVPEDQNDVNVARLKGLTSLLKQV
jgi:hypothetical protein